MMSSASSFSEEDATTTSSSSHQAIKLVGKGGGGGGGSHILPAPKQRWKLSNSGDTAASVSASGDGTAPSGGAGKPRRRTVMGTRRISICPEESEAAASAISAAVATPSSAATAVVVAEEKQEEREGEATAAALMGEGSSETANEREREKEKAKEKRKAKGTEGKGKEKERETGLGPQENGKQREQTTLGRDTQRRPKRGVVTIGRMDGPSSPLLSPVMSPIMSPHSPAGSSSRLPRPHKALKELLQQPDMKLLLATCDAIDEANAREQLVKALAELFVVNDCVMPLLKLMISKEVLFTVDPTTLFRGNSFATKMMSAYAKLIGEAYVQDILREPIQTLCATDTDCALLEIDETKLRLQMGMPAEPLPDAQDEETVASAVAELQQRNVAKLIKVTDSFLNIILNSLPKMPRGFLVIASHLWETVNKKFPNHKHAAVAGFIFLRFLCPIIVNPKGWQLVDELPSRDAQRALILVSKILQLLANGVLSMKEKFMQVINPFIDEKLPAVYLFLQNMASQGNALTNSQTLPSNKDTIESSSVLREELRLGDRERSKMEKSSLENLQRLLQFNIHKIGRVLVADALSKEPEQLSSRQYVAVNSQKQGYLHKMGGESFKAWTKRWFVLKKGFLYYFKSPQHSNSSGVIPLEDSHVQDIHTQEAIDSTSSSASHFSERLEELTATDSFSKATLLPCLYSYQQQQQQTSAHNNNNSSTTSPTLFLFKVVTTYRTYFLNASSSEERKEWTEAIQQAIYAQQVRKERKRLSANREKNNGEENTAPTSAPSQQQQHKHATTNSLVPRLPLSREVTATDTVKEENDKNVRATHCWSSTLPSSVFVSLPVDPAIRASALASPKSSAHHSSSAAASSSSSPSIQSFSPSLYSPTSSSSSSASSSISFSSVSSSSSSSSSSSASSEVQHSGRSRAATTTVTKKGFLGKRGEVVKTWNQRWIVLKDNLLIYFKSPSDPLPKGEIEIQNSFVRTCEAKPGEGPSYSFELSTSGKKTIFFSAPDEATMKSWMDAIKKQKNEWWKNQRALRGNTTTISGNSLLQQNQQHQPHRQTFISSSSSGSDRMKSPTPTERERTINIPSTFSPSTHSNNTLHSATDAEVTQMNEHEVMEYDNHMPVVEDGRGPDISSSLAGVRIGSHETKKSGSKRFMRLWGKHALSTAEKEGWLMKKGANIQSWRRRWCVVTNGKLFYFRSPLDEKPAGMIELLQTAVELASVNLGREKPCFQVLTRTRCYFFEADDVTAALAWIKALQGSALHANNQEVRRRSALKRAAGARKTGWLFKQGGKFQTWRKRWVVLEYNLLSYYKTPQVLFSFLLRFFVAVIPIFLLSVFLLG
ncbi:phosphatidylinositol-3,4,5-trisphosphate binding [Balamuthia mandrillaris]